MLMFSATLSVCFGYQLVVSDNMNADIKIEIEIWKKLSK